MTGAPLRTVQGLTLLCALATALLVPVLGWGAPVWWAAAAVALAVGLSEAAVVHLQFGRQRWCFSLTEGALGAALVFGTGSWVVLGVLLGVAGAQAVQHRSGLKVAFNVSQFALSTAVAVLAAEHAGGGLPGALAGVAAFFAVNHCLVAVAVAVTSARRLLPLLLSSAPLSAVHTAGNASIGLLAAHLARTAPVGLLGLLVPLLLLWTSYDQQTRRSAEARLFAELARGQERASGRSVDVSAQVVLTAAARLFGGADVEMVLLAPEGPVRYAGDEQGVPRRLRVDPDAFDEPWVLRALGAGRVSTGSEDARPYCAAVLGPAGAPLAVLVARRAAGAGAFGRGEVRLAEVLVGQAESWLSVSDLSARHAAAAEQVQRADGAARALGDLGAATSPTLLVLRDSADRLARLAEAAGEVDDIVEELHLVERSVASLLGAIALAAEPDLVAPVDLATPVRAVDDWTTTGVLR